MVYSMTIHHFLFYTMTRLFILLLLACSITTYAQKVDSLALKKAETLITQQKYSEARAVYDKLIADDSSIACYFDRRGYLLYTQNKFQEAVNDFSHALLLEPNEPWHYYFRSLALYNSENPDEAIADCNDALKHMHANDSLKWLVLLNRGSAEEMKRDFEPAYNDFKVLLDHDSTFYGALTNMGMVLDDMGRDNEALVYLQKVVRMYPKMAIGYSNLAFWQQRHGNYTQSVEVVNEGFKHLEADETTLRAVMYNNRGYSKLKLKQLNEAMSDINSSLKIYPTNSYALRNRALVYLAMNNKDMACEDLHASLKEGFTLMYGNEVEKLMKENCPSYKEEDDATH